jgi:hypothetical protein
MSRWLAIQNLKRSRVQRRVVACIIPKLCYSQPLLPMRWTGMTKASETSFQTLVNPLCLPICLWVVWGAHFQGRASKFEQVCHKELVKILSLSDIKASWCPCNLNTLSIYAIATWKVVNGCLRGIKWANLENLSTTTKIQLKCLDRGKPSIKSRLTIF